MVATRGWRIEDGSNGEKGRILRVHSGVANAGNLGKKMIPTTGGQRLHGRGIGMMNGLR